MEHGDGGAMRCRFGRVIAHRKQGERGVAFADESRNAVPHSFVPFFESEYVHVPLERAFDVTHGQRDVVDAFVLDHRADGSPARCPLQRVHLSLAYMPHARSWILARFFVFGCRSYAVTIGRLAAI